MVNLSPMSVLERLIGSSRYQQLLAWFFRPIDGSSMALFRMGYGGIMLWEVTRYFDHNWIKSYYSGKEFYFTYPGFSWVVPWPSLELMEAHFILIGVLSTMVFLGLCYRVAAAGLAVTFSYVYLLKQARYLNHFYFVILVAVAMIFIPANRSWSADSWLKKRVSWWPFLKNCSPYTDNWGLWAIRAQFGITYFYGGLAKLNEDWLRGYPLSDWIADETDVIFIGQWVAERWMGLFLSYAGLILDLLFVPLLLYKPTRWLGFVLALAFNFMNDQMFSIGIFPLFMVIGTFTFFEADWPKRFWDFCTIEGGKHVEACGKRASLLASEKAKLLLARPKLPRSEGGFKFTTSLRSSRATDWQAGQRLLAGFMVVFFAYQFLFPFRHFLYPGSVHWTEEGHMYAWHMKLRSKRGRTEFTIKDPDSGRAFKIDPDDYLNNRQERKMRTRPMMILQFSHWLRDNYREQGMKNVEIYVDSFASLNGREEQRLVDPSYDLAQIEWSVWPAEWIVPLHTERK